MDSSRPYFWQLTILSSLLPLAGILPAISSFVDTTPTADATTTVQTSVNNSTQIFPLPQVAERRVKRSIRLTVTAYSSTVDQTDADPFTTASGQKVRDGIIAYNGLPFGTRVRFPDAFGDKVFVVQDRMHPRKGHYVADIWMETREQAKQWGAPVITMEILGS